MGFFLYAILSLIEVIGCKLFDLEPGYFPIVIAILCGAESIAFAIGQKGKKNE